MRDLLPSASRCRCGGRADRGSARHLSPQCAARRCGAKSASRAAASAPNAARPRSRAKSCFVSVHSYRRTQSRPPAPTGRGQHEQPRRAGFELAVDVRQPERIRASCAGGTDPRCRSPRRRRRRTVRPTASRGFPHTVGASSASPAASGDRRTAHEGARCRPPCSAAADRRRRASGRGARRAAPQLSMSASVSGSRPVVTRISGSRPSRRLSRSSRYSRAA